MTRSIALSFTLCTLLSPLCQADQIIREVPDTTAGKGFGALTGMMVGAAGGPIGALVGATGGFFAGSAVQAGIGKSETCLLYTSPSPRDRTRSRMPSSA